MNAFGYHTSSWNNYQWDAWLFREVWMWQYVSVLGDVFECQLLEQHNSVSNWMRLILVHRDPPLLVWDTLLRLEESTAFLLSDGFDRQWFRRSRFHKRDHPSILDHPKNLVSWNVVTAVGAQDFIVLRCTKPFTLFVAAVFYLAGPRDVSYTHRIDSNETQREIWWWTIWKGLCTSPPYDLMIQSFCMMQSEFFGKQRFSDNLPKNKKSTEKKVLKK